MQGQVELAEPPCERRQEAFRVPLVLEPDDHIIGVAHDDGIALGPLGPPFTMEPEVENIVQVNVRQCGIWEPYDSGNLSRCGC